MLLRFVGDRSNSAANARLISLSFTRGSVTIGCEDMQRRNKKSSSQQKDLTSQYLAGSMDEDRIDTEQRFTDRSKHSQQNKIMKTAAMREDQLVHSADFDTLPQGMV